MIIVFDTETTGLPPKGESWETHTSEYPYVCQLAWQIYNKGGQILYEASHIIKPDGWSISKGASDVNKITNKHYYFFLLIILFLILISNISMFLYS